ncbi:hypothetical protein CALCODRAFT_553513 [Calocera cornea HHB12733]|uniref:NADAR domain-containing protein n=1 Tax=Calocera cornea HHB12733 TaxID=1353952 RepID=A0A165INZ2_9BASI|nr:hypothetical protein CALCODRAFT_553513 [Calocera cornea HHB12733]
MSMYLNPPDRPVPPPPEWVQRNYQRPYYPRQQYDNRPWFTAVVFDLNGNVIPPPVNPPCAPSSEKPLRRGQAAVTLFPVHPAPPTKHVDLGDLLAQLSDVTDWVRYLSENVACATAAVAGTLGAQNDTARGAILDVDDSPITVQSGWPFPWDSQAPFADLSLLSPHPVIHDGVEYPTAANLFFALKFEGDEVAMATIATAFDPEWAATDRSLVGRIRGDWHSIAYGKLIEVLRLKFEQHPDLAAELLSTGYRPFIDRRRDRPDNIFGQALEAVRELLRG